MYGKLKQSGFLDKSLQFVVRRLWTTSSPGMMLFSSLFRT